MKNPYSKENMDLIQEIIQDVDHALELKGLERIPIHLYKFFQEPSIHAEREETFRQPVKVDIGF